MRLTLRQYALIICAGLLVGMLVIVLSDHMVRRPPSIRIATLVLIIGAWGFAIKALSGIEKYGRLESYAIVICSYVAAVLFSFLAAFVL